MVLGKKGFIAYSFFFVIFLFIGLLIINQLPKGQLVMQINQNYSSEYLNIFFKYFTWLGLGITFAILIVLLGFKRLYFVFVGLIILVLNGLITFLFKQILFKGMLRPTKYLDTESLNLIEGFTYHGSNSFPSGHTFTAFAMFTMLALIINNRIYGFIFFAFALLIGISRMYLLQHFFIDIYAGAILGFICSVLVMYLGEKFRWEEKIKILKKAYIKK